MHNLDEIKQVIKTYYKEADCGIFDTRNIVGDEMETIYIYDDVIIDICRDWA